MKWLISVLMTVVMTIGSWLGLPCKTSDRMTNEEARILAADILERAEQIYDIMLAELPGDHELVAILPNGMQVFRVGENPLGIYSIADLKALVEKTYTKEYAQKMCGIDPDYCWTYYEEDGVLYFEENAGDSGESPDPSTAKVKSQTEDTLVLTMKYDREISNNKVTWQLKWEDDAWKLDHSIWGY